MTRASLFLVLSLLFSTSQGFITSCPRSRDVSRTSIDLFKNSGSQLSNLFGGQSKGPEVVLTIPAKQVKVGALRFLLQIYIVGEQNKPEKNTWLTKQGESGEIQVYFTDGTAMLSLDLQEYNVRAIRYGEKPSLRYRLQESVLLHGILDELDNVAFGTEDIDEDKRLLRVSNDNAIEEARSSLSARPE